MLDNSCSLRLTLNYYEDHLTSISLSFSLVFLQLLTRFQKSWGATTSLFTFKKNVCREKMGGETTLPAPLDAMCMASEDRPSRQPYPCTIGNVQPLRDDVLYSHGKCVGAICL